MTLIPHWRYFLSLERDFIETLRYVEYNDTQKSVYSFEFARLLMVSCAELDVVLKVAAERVAPGCGADSIGKYYDALCPSYRIQDELARVDNFSLVLQPYQSWTRDTPPDWWTAHNRVKHRRHEHFAQATVHNVLLALSGLFVANLIALHAHDEISAVREIPRLLSRDSEPGGLLTLEGDYEVLVR